MDNRIGAEEKGKYAFQEEVVNTAEDLFAKKEYSKCISYIESKIDDVRRSSDVSRENGVKVFQIYDEYNYFYFTKLAKIPCLLDFDYEYHLILIMVDCYFRMNKPNKCAPLIEEGLKLVPYDSLLYSFKIQIAKNKNDAKALKEILDDYIAHTWRATELYKICLNYAYYYMHEKKYEVAKNYLVVAGYYDISEDATEIVKGEIEYLESISGIKADIDDFMSAIEYLDSNGYPYKVTEQTEEVVLQMYTNYLNPSIEIPDEELNFLRNNLLIITFGKEWVARLIECLVLNDTKYYEKDGYAYQINRRWNDTLSYYDDLLPDNGANLIGIYEREAKLGGKMLMYTFSRYATKESAKELEKFYHPDTRFENNNDEEKDAEDLELEKEIEQELAEEDAQQDVAQIVKSVGERKDEEERDIISEQKAKELLKSNAKEVVSEETFTAENGFEVYKFVSKDENGQTIYDYMFQFVRDTFGAIRFALTDNERLNKTMQDEAINIINSWENFES